MRLSTFLTGRRHAPQVPESAVTLRNDPMPGANGLRLFPAPKYPTVENFGALDHGTGPAPTRPPSGFSSYLPQAPAIT
jgi:hypothetical protein